MSAYQGSFIILRCTGPDAHRVEIVGSADKWVRARTLDPRDPMLCDDCGHRLVIRGYRGQYVSRYGRAS